MKIAVIGAGIAGVTTAFLAQQQGHEVTIFDHNGIANRCSFANGGQISVCNAEVWNSYSNVLKGMKWMFQKDAPLAMRFDHWSLDKIKWVAGFLGAIPNKEINTRKTIELALRSRELLKALPIEFDRNDCGILHIYRNNKSFDKATESSLKYEDSGWGRTPVSVDEMKEIEPNLNYSGIVGGQYTKDDFTGDINKFCKELLVHSRRMGVHHVNKKIEDLSELDNFDRVFICTGAYTKDLMQTKVYPIKGYSITVKNTNAPNTSILDDDAKIVTSNFGDRFRVAGTAELAGWDDSIKYERIQPLVDWVHRNTNEITSEMTMWACLRPMNPDMLPTVERSGKYIVNTGAGHLGWTMSMALAEKAVDLI